MNTMAALINQARFPLTEPESPVLIREIESLRHDLQRTGAAEAPAFLSDAGLDCCVADGRALLSRQYKSVGEGSAYLEEPAAHWPKDHPRAIRRRYSVGVVAYDQFPTSSPIRGLYEWAPVMNFVGAVL